MGRYINWADVVDRYPEIDSLADASDLQKTYIVYAEGLVDGQLYNHFVTPFSSNNLTVKDLCVDLAYWRAGRHKLDNAVEVGSSAQETIMALRDRQMVMVTTSGEVIEGISRASAGFSSTNSYTPIFGVDEPEDWQVDPDQVEGILVDRS